MTDDRITAEILRQVAARGPAKSICPSDVARALEPEEAAWRRLMGPVRARAVRLAQAGRIEVLRKGKPVDPGAEIRGVIRLRIAGGGAAEGTTAPQATGPGTTAKDDEA